MKGHTQSSRQAPLSRANSRLTTVLAAAVMVVVAVAGLVALAWYVSGATPG